MPTLNEKTGFYRGDIVERDGELYATGCVSTAVANYLHLHKIPNDTIENVLKDLMESPEHRDSGFTTSVIPEVVERALRTHVDRDVQVTLYGNIYDNIPDEKQSHIKSVPAGTTVPYRPFIAVTELEKGLNHLWVATAAGDQLERIDSDGKVHKEPYPVGAYLEIKGL